MVLCCKFAKIIFYLYYIFSKFWTLIYFVQRIHEKVWTIKILVPNLKRNAAFFKNTMVMKVYNIVVDIFLVLDREI